MQGNRFGYECPLPSESFYIQDLDCNGAEAPASITATDLEEEVETEASTAPESLIATDLEERNEESTAVRSLSDRLSTQASPSITSATSSSSSNILVPILATIAAVCFALVVVLVARLIKKRKTQRAAMVAQEISLSDWPDSQQETTKETKDNAPMYAGAGSSAPV